MKDTCFETDNSEIIFGENIESTLNDLSGEPKNFNDFNFPASLTPMVTYTKELLCNHSDKLYPDVCNILRQSFASHCLLHPEMFRSLKNLVTIDEKESNMRCMRKIPRILSSIIPHSFPSVPVNTLVIKENKSPKTKLKRKHSELDESLSDITDKLLKKRLVEVKGEFREKINDPSCVLAEDFNSKKFSLSKAYEHYWYLHGNFYLYRRPIDNEDFDELSRKMFSSSFFSLLKECSRLIGIFPRDLYYEVVNAEIRLS